VPALVTSIQSAIQSRIRASKKPHVWTADDFADLGSRAAIDLALHRLVSTGDLRRIARGLYDLAGINSLTGKPTSPDPRDVIHAVPARVDVLTDGRLRPIKLGNMTLNFHYAAPSRLYWADRPAMRFVQALHWLRDLLPSDDGQLRRRLVSILRDPAHGAAIRDDLRAGLSALSEWMREIVRDLLRQAETDEPAEQEVPPAGRPAPRRAPVSAPPDAPMMKSKPRAAAR